MKFDKEEIVDTDILSLVKQKRAANQMRRKVKNLSDFCKRIGDDLYKALWANENITPQEIFDRLGMDGKEFLNVFDKVQGIIRNIESGYTKLEHPNELTVNEDDTVTVGDEI